MEAPKTAFCGTVCEAPVHREQAQEVSCLEDVADLLVELGAFLCISIRPISLELMGEVARGDEDAFASELLCGCLDGLAELIVGSRGEAREADTHILRALVVVLDEMDRDHRCMVERAVLLIGGAGRKVALLRKPVELVREFLVVGNLVACFRCSELSEGATCSLARRDVVVVPVHHGMGRGDHYRVRSYGSDAPAHFLVGIYRLLDALLFAPTDFGDDQWRMRNRECSSNAHDVPPKCACTRDRACNALLYIPRHKLLNMCWVS